MNGSEIERRFDNGEDVSEFFDWSRAVRPNLEHDRIALPTPLLARVETRARQLGITREALIERWITERLG